ncbi:MAG: BrnT family toxin [Deltaproteobacteria bacterium]|nr:BrnT family toxin [Deltaproteobacteria bacterium]
MNNKYVEIEWDEFHSGKNLQKHGVTDLEIVQVFSNPYVIMKHKRFPDRRIVLEATHGDRYLFMSIQISPISPTIPLIMALPPNRQTI